MNRNKIFAPFCGTELWRCGFVLILEPVNGGNNASVTGFDSL